MTDERAPHSPKQMADWVAHALALAGLALLVLLPLAYVPFTYEHAYLKTFLFQTAGLLLFLSALGGCLLGRVYWRRPFRGGLSLTTAMVAWVDWNLVSYLWAKRPALALERAAETALMVFLGLGVGYALSRPARRKWWLLAMIISLVPAGAYTVWVYSHPYEQRLANLFSNRNLAAPFFYLPFSIAVSACISSWRNKRNRQAVIGFVALGASFALIVAGTHSAAAIACLIVVLPAGFVFASQYRRHLFWIVPACFVVLALAATLTDSYSLKDLRDPLSESSVGVRLDHWAATLGLIELHPHGGVGAGGFIAAIPRFRSPDSYGHPLSTPALHHAHSFPLETMAELGPIGVGLFGWIVYLALARSFRSARTDKGLDRMLSRGLFTGLLALIAHSFVGVGLSYTEVQGMFWLAVGLVLATSGVNEGDQRAQGASFAVRAVPAGVFCIVSLTCWFLASLNPLRAQVSLSQGVRLQKVAEDAARPMGARRTAARDAVRAFDRSSSFLFAGRAHIPAVLHLASTLDMGASEMAPDGKSAQETRSAALAVQQQLLADYPDYGALSRNIAHTAYKLGNDPLALDAARDQTGLNPWDTKSYEIWLLAAKRSGDPESLREALTRMDIPLASRQDDVDFLYLKAGAYLQLGESEKATESLRRVEEVCTKRVQQGGPEAGGPALLKFHLYLAKVLMKGRPNEAAKHCDAVLSISPGHPVASHILKQLRVPRQ